MEYNWLLIFQITIIFLGNIVFYKTGYLNGQCAELEKHVKYLESLVERWEKKYDDK